MPRFSGFTDAEISEIRLGLNRRLEDLDTLSGVFKHYGTEQSSIEQGRDTVQKMLRELDDSNQPAGPANELCSESVQGQ